jgi:hypothetical protein
MVRLCQLTIIDICNTSNRTFGYYVLPVGYENRLRNVNFNKLGLRLLMTIEGYRRHGVSFLLEERKRRITILAPVYEELLEQLGRSLWRLMFDTERGDQEEAAELLDIIRKWEEKVRDRVERKTAGARIRTSEGWVGGS